MFLLRRAALLILLGFACAAGPAPAQDVRPQDEAPNEPPKTLPKPQRGDRAKNLDALFDALKVAPDDDTAKVVEGRIWALWLQTPSDTASLLMARSRSAVDGNDLDLALKLLNAVIEIKPDYAEAWNRRATVHYMRKEYGPAIADIRQVLIREPRHFGALSGLGFILEQIGDDKRALDAFRRAVAVYPRLPKISERIKTLTEKVEGRDI